MVVCCGATIGISKRKMLCEHASFIAGMASACEKMAAEISQRHTPPQALFRKLSDDSTSAGKFFAAVSDKTVSSASAESVWSLLLCEYANKYALSREEISELERVATAITGYELESAVETITYVGRSLSSKAGELNVTAEKDGKMWLSICSAVGAVVALILL